MVRNRRLSSAGDLSCGHYPNYIKRDKNNLSLNWPAGQNWFYGQRSRKSREIVSVQQRTFCFNDHLAEQIHSRPRVIFIVQSPGNFVDPQTANIRPFASRDFLKLVSSFYDLKLSSTIIAIIFLLIAWSCLMRKHVFSLFLCASPSLIARDRAPR